MHYCLKSIYMQLFEAKSSHSRKLWSVYVICWSTGEEFKGVNMALCIQIVEESCLKQIIHKSLLVSASKWTNSKVWKVELEFLVLLQQRLKQQPLATISTVCQSWKLSNITIYYLDILDAHARVFSSGGCFLDLQLVFSTVVDFIIALTI